MPENTSNHGYRRPSRGAKNWHVPLNENFASIDAGVEIRDAESNRGEYEPKEEAKFLATDTGTIYIGTGDQWQALGCVLTTVESTPDGTMVSAPGNLQSAIDKASTGTAYAEKPTQTVRLVSGKKYNITDTIKIRENVRVECNGARIVPAGNFNIFELHQGTQLVNPFCDTRGRDWDSVQIVVGPKDAGKLGTPNRAWVKDAYLIGESGTGVGLQFRGGDKPCTMQYATGTIKGFERAIDMYAAGESSSGDDGSWSNGNVFHGRIEDYSIGISMRSEGAPVSGNFIQIQTQPGENAEWLWKMKADPRNNRGDGKYSMTGNNVVAYPWDSQNYENNNPYYQSKDRRAPIWFIGQGQRYGNSLWDLSGTLSNQFIVNNSDNDSRNGIFTSHGGFVTGTHRFKQQPIYEPNNGTRWHRKSNNG